jgi:glycogen operon protein
MTELVAQLTSLRRAFPQLRSRRWVEGRRADGSYGVLWLTPQATEMTETDWQFPEGHFLSYVLGPTQPGQEPLYIVLNAAAETIDFVFPKLLEYSRWLPLLDTVSKVEPGKEHPSDSGGKASPRSVLAFSGQL